MPTLTFEKPKLKKEDKDKVQPICIVKGDNAKFHNRFLYLDTRERIPEGEKGFKKIEIPEDCFFSILPSSIPDKREIYYVAGCSGSGKSYIARSIVSNYHRMYPDRPVFLVSKLAEDKTLDDMEAKPIRLDYSKWVEAPPNVNEFSNCCFIFDDYDCIEGKEGKVVQQFIDDIASMGRAHSDTQGNITMLCLSHYLSRYSRTRLLINETSHFIVYPQSTSHHALSYLLKTHLGMDKDDVKRLKKMGRWVLLHKSYPQYLLSSHSCELLHQD